MRNKRKDHGCFSIEENGQVTKIVAMGGSYHGRLSTAEILDVKSMQWQDLPDLPFAVKWNKGVESKIGPYLGFSVAGWSDTTGNEKRIIGLRKNQNGNNYYWEQANSLTTGRMSPTVVNAPISMVPSC